MAPRTDDEPKSKAVSLLKTIETGDSEPIAAVDADRYRQHNLSVANGLEGFGAALAALPEGSARHDGRADVADGGIQVALLGCGPSTRSEG